MNDNLGQDVSPASEYLRIIKRRRLLAGGIAALTIAGSVSVALVLPVKYQSTATILIEDPAVSDDITKAPGMNFADQRLQLIQQRVMTTERLLGVIDRVGLYKDRRQITPPNVLADDMRTQVLMKLVGLESTGGGDGRNARVSTAFTLSFTGRDPVSTQQVTRELVDLYLAENERAQRNRAVGTAGFFNTEANRLSERIKELETQLADFKTKNSGMLPEEMEFNRKALERSQDQLFELMRQAQTTRERQAFLQAQLLTLEPQAPVANSTSPETLSPRARLRLLNTQYNILLSKYGDKHPDVVRLRRLIDALTGSADQALEELDLDQLQAELLAASQKYGEAHPEVTRLKREIKAVQAASNGKRALETPDNPVYVQTAGQLNAINAELRLAQGQIAAMQEKVSAIEVRLMKGPEVERDYAALKREYDNAVATLADLRNRESQAELAKNLETEQMGQRLSLIEPPPLPSYPISPNRPAIVLLGLLLGVGGGIGCAMLVDSLDGKVYGPRRLAAISGSSPLVLIPRIDRVSDPRPKRHRLGMAILSLLVAASVMMSDFSFGDFRALWNSVMGKVAPPESSLESTWNASNKH